MENFIDNFYSQDKTICVGLDPDIEKIPLEYKNLREENAVFLFTKEIIKLTKDYAAAFKIQKAFIDLYGGKSLLRKIVSECHALAPNTPVFVDCKIGDIDNTMGAYLKNIFDYSGADGIVINPYMGEDVFRAFDKYGTKFILVLVKTSNMGASIVQDVRLRSGGSLWEYILGITIKEFKKKKNIIPILSEHGDLEKIRRIVPENMIFFYAGVGAQRGDLNKIRYLLNKNKKGVIVNSSRKIIYPYSPEDKNWRIKVRESINELNLEINKIKNNKIVLIAGPSGIGKSSLIQELCKNFPEMYGYVRPYTTRKLRTGEKDKIHISKKHFFKLIHEEEIIYPNKFYGEYYGPSKKRIEMICRRRLTPIIDWPIDKICEIKKILSNFNIIVVYLTIPNIDLLKERIGHDNRDTSGKRIKEAIKEMSNIRKGRYKREIDSYFNNVGDIRRNSIKLNKIITGYR